MAGYKTKITEYLDSHKVKYRLLPHEKEALTCEEAAKCRDVLLDEMVKCMFLVSQGNFVLACLSASSRLDIKKVEKLIGIERLKLSTKKQIKEMIGYIIGAVPPISFNDKVKVVYDDAIEKKQKINMSSADPMCGIELNPADLISLVKPLRGDIKKSEFTSDIVIGLEIHVELDTDSKLFCSCPTEAEEPNTACCDICLGMPGSKPVLNRKVVEYALRLCMALGCRINPELVFSRKTYFYPDMAKNYQITQYEIPLGEEGSVQVSDTKRVNIVRVHIEEDPASLVHQGSMQSSPFVLVDYNRSGRPLCEIVTAPDIESPEQARDFMRKLITILNYLSIFDQQRCIIKADANISLRESRYTRAEVKNITGFKEIERALNYEIRRQKDAVKAGEKLRQETRAWDAEQGVTFSLRSKETEEDYGYITDPDLVAIDITGSMIGKIKKDMPELAHEKVKKFVTRHKISEIDAKVIAEEKELAELFEKVAEEVDPVLAAKWLRRELVRVMNYSEKTFSQLEIDETHIIELLSMVESREITENVAKKIFEQLMEKPFSPKEYVKKQGLGAVSDAGALERYCKEAIGENPKVVDDYRSGEQKAFNFLVGQVMGKTKGAATPKEVNEILKKLLE